MTSPAQCLDAIDATWPAARKFTQGPFTMRDGQGGGNRVSAATLSQSVPSGCLADEIDRAAAAMRDMGQTPLFMVRAGEQALDDALAAKGYLSRDETVLWTIPVDRLTDVAMPRVMIFDVWPPLAIQRDIWNEAGIGPHRQAIMARASGAKAALLARRKDQPAGVAFVACDGPVAMVHAVEVRPDHRRAGMAGWLMRAAAHWAVGQGSMTLALLCTRENFPANRLYSSLGMTEQEGYHYRKHPDEQGSLK
jgi:GNAT superfamily N-acetyltransferase